LEGIPKAAHKFLFEGPNAGLADFSARIEMVGHLEIFSKAEIKDLHRIRKIRNEFAHDFTGVSFDAQKVADLCGALKITKDDRGPLTPRECYKRATLQFMITILCQIRSHGEDD
jgi:DNA-binding MltR family transcriptional regulator